MTSSDGVLSRDGKTKVDCNLLFRCNGRAMRAYRRDFPNLFRT